jgi:long-chain fatty acid transport protein
VIETNSSKKLNEAIMKFAYLTTLGALALSTTAAHSGGWETGKLDTSFLYEDGNYVELSYGNLDYSVNGTTQAGVTHPMAKDQTRTSISGKFQIGGFDIGLTSFGSGAIQMDGQNSATIQTDVNAFFATPTCAAMAANSAAGVGACAVSVVPSADVKLDTQAIMGRYSFNDSWSATVGLRQAKLKASTVMTLAAEYAIDATNKTGMVYGIAYEIPKYALKVEVLQSEAIMMGLTGTASGVGLATGVNSTLAASSALAIPKATTIKLQTGIAEDTLLMASAHRVGWAASQIVIDVNGVAAFDTGSNFSDSTSYSVGLGRQVSEDTAVSLTYSWEDGSGAAATSPFTMSNGSKTLSAGVKHKIDALTISAGASYTKAGDVNVTHMAAPTVPSGYTASYAGNSVMAFGLKVGFNF